MKKNLVLLGMMAVGKTTLGKIVAKIQGLEFIDIDTNIEKRNSMSINEIFNKKGEKFFRTEEEKEVLNSLKKKNCVIALGGGAFVNKIIRVNVLKDAISVWLDVDIDILNKRVKWSQKRPLLQEKNNKKILEKLYEKRKEFYKQANYKIACNKLNKQDVIKKIITLYAKQ
ncbi:MAG: shikimate kinase [Pelagibacteraceae bacterium]|nr:shikimate kinase [Candidatus Pelagibacter sp.]MDP6681010.1 shikimate kinase [Pelagibacteraceae bacterium]MDP6710504.1 shikimate kinase [Pelagibacteraceae bacterium]